MNSSDMFGNEVSKKKEAWTLYNSGSISQARDVCTDIYNSGYIDAELTYLFGCCEIDSGDTFRAIELFKECLVFDESQENAPYVHIALGSAYNVIGNYDEAEKNFLAAKNLNPSLIEPYLGLAETFNSRKDYKKAEENYLHATSLFPNVAFPYFKLGQMAEHKADHAEAVKFLKKAVDCDSTVCEYHELLCEELVLSESFEEAVVACDIALASWPLNIAFKGRKSVACARTGAYEDALECIEIILKSDDLLPEVATSFLTISKHIDRCDDAIAYARKCLLKENIKDAMTAALYAQLALVMDHCGNFDDAWTCINQSKKYKRTPESKVYDPVVQKVITDKQMAAFTSAALFSVPACNVQHEITPIFIIGMPRSGTSLLEQILAAHADVSAGGELTYITEIVQAFSRDIGTSTDWPDCIREVSQEKMNDFSQRYLDRVAEISSSSIYITDKMPHNFFNLGLIQLLFPKAKIIHCRRHVLDTCISIYFQNFSMGHEYSDNLFDIGTHYSQYERLMKHWELNLSIPILNLDYETLVQDPEHTIRKILDFCGMPWDENCLNFNKLKRMVKTASFDQVKQPIYKKSVERWKNYEKYLDDLNIGLQRGF